MTDRKYKCYGKECVEQNLKYPKDELYQYAGKNYCFPHYQAKLKDKESRERLYGLIQKHFGIPYPTGLMLGQIKKFQNTNHYTLDGIAEAVDYMASQSWVNLDSKYGLGLVPHVYEDAQENKKRADAQSSIKFDYKEQNITVAKKDFEKENEVVRKEKFDFTK